MAMLLCLSSWCFACSGELSAPLGPVAGDWSDSTRGRDADGDGVADEPGAHENPILARCESKAVGPSALKRLTHREYDNAVRDLLGDTLQRAQAFAPDTQQDLFDTMADQSVSSLLGEQYLTSAVELAEAVSDVPRLLGCDPAGATGSGCVEDFVKRFARRAFRRPLVAAEKDRLLVLYEQTRTAADANTGVRAVLSAVLASPNFLFRPEFGGQSSSLPEALKASAFEIAARLSFLLWSSVPDEVVLDAAANNLLSSPQQIEKQARRMLADPRARTSIEHVYREWFGLGLLDTTTKDSQTYPQFDDALRAAMLEETRRFVNYVMWEDDAKLATLLTAPYTFVDGALAKLYDLNTPNDAASFTKVSLDPERRAGVLTQASVLTAYAASNESSPVKRGKWVRTRMLCQDLPHPPPNVPALPPPKQGVSTRERFAMHTASPACGGCHQLIDGLGFGLEHYDGIGAYRTKDLGVPIDASGEVTSTADIDGAYEGGPELADLLADSAQVRACAPLQWFRYSLGRRETDEDACSLAALQKTFAESDGDLKELVVALTQTDAFLNYRKPD
ncbi:MAG: DUF1592 domain-containing protein [Myxococcales bacterium]